MTRFIPISSFIKRLRYGARLDPARDWLVVLIFFSIAFLGIVVWNVWAFDTVAGGGVIGTPAPSATATFDRTSLEAIRTIFESRADEEAKYVTGVYRYADPSR